MSHRDTYHGIMQPTPPRDHPEERRPGEHIGEWIDRVFLHRRAIGKSLLGEHPEERPGGNEFEGTRYEELDRGMRPGSEWFPDGRTPPWPEAVTNTSVQASAYDFTKEVCFDRFQKDNNVAFPRLSVPAEPKTKLTTDPVARKDIPLATAFLDYFPDAIAAVAAVSRQGQKQHGTPGWDRSKSPDESDSLLRHFVERGTIDTDGHRHSAKVAWRALALLQKEIEAGRGPGLVPF